MSIRDFNERLQSDEPGDEHFEALRRLTQADDVNALKEARLGAFWQAWYLQE